MNLSNTYNQYRKDFQSYGAGIWAALDFTEFKECSNPSNFAFTAVMSKNMQGHYELGLAERGQSGYYPLKTYFKTQDYSKANEIALSLNKHFLLIDIKESYKIVFSSLNLKKAI